MIILCMHYVWFTYVYSPLSTDIDPTHMDRKNTEGSNTDTFPTHINRQDSEGLSSNKDSGYTGESSSWP